MLPKTPNVPPPPLLSQAAVYADRAISVMRGFGVLPLPKHFSVFFAYAAGQPTDLCRDIEGIKLRRERFSDEILDKLYNRYIAEEQMRVVQDTATNARKIIQDMMNSVSTFAGATSHIGADVARELAHLDEHASQEMLRVLANTLIESATTIQSSSETMTERLAGAEQQIADLKEDLARVTTEAERDFLTGVFNRKAFDKRLVEAIKIAQEKDSQLSLLMIDIDHFKQFNDQHGHLIGDEVLKIVARTLKDTLKGADIVARFGGEEFAVILPRTPLSGAMVVAESIRKSIASRALKRRTTGETFGVISVSMGVASFRIGEESAELIARADGALYRSKNEGRNRVTREA